MTKYLLIRHVQSLFNAGNTTQFDSDITEQGKYQVQEVALHVKEFIAKGHFKGFVSPYLRALKTALLIHNRWAVPMTVDFRIGEVPEEVKSWRKSHLPNREIEFPTYEWRNFPEKGITAHSRTLDEYWENLQDFVAEISENAIIISHTNTIQDLIGLLTGIQNPRNKPIPNGSVSYIERGKDTTTC